MDHPPTPEEKPQEHVREEQGSWRKSKYFLWLSSSSALIGIFIAVTIVVAGSIIVFGNNASQKTKHKQVAQKQQAKKEKLNARNVKSQLAANAKKLQKRINRANRSLQSSGQSGAAKEKQTYGASVGGVVTEKTVRLQTDQRVNELWQAQNAVEANSDLSSSLRSQIVRKIGSKMNKLHALEGDLQGASEVELADIADKVQDQKVYSCYLPNITKQTVNEDFAALTREQITFTKELQGVSGDFKKQGKKTANLSELIADRNRQLRDINTNVKSLRQSGIQAENSNCATPSPIAIAPISKGFTDLSTLDEQIRQMVDQMLADQGVKKSAPTSVPKDKKLARQEAKNEKKSARQDNKKTKPQPTADQPLAETPTTAPDENIIEEPTPLSSEGPTDAPALRGEPLEKPNFPSLGLPNPQADVANELKAHIEENEKATWAVTALLAAEKNTIEKGMNVIPYLTTGWIWFENGKAAWPDPYEINCNDNRAGYFSEVSVICTVNNFQVGGYQAAAQKSQYVSLFTKFYDPEELPEVVKRVASDSINALRPQWNYNDPGQQKGVLKQYITQLGSVKMGDISPNVDFFSEKGQFFSLLVGKDPNMVIAFNSSAVSDDDLVAALKAGGCAYQYICAENKQLLSNMVAALYLIDGGTL